MATGLPHAVNGRVSDETEQQIRQAERDTGATESALVRMALEDFMPRYLAGQTKNQNAELMKKLGEAIQRKPALIHELQVLLISATRPARRVR